MLKPYKELTLKERFNLQLDHLIINKKMGFAILVTIPGVETPELIINDKDALEEKQAYWNEVYDDNLIHKHNEEIRIIAFDQFNNKEIKNIKESILRWFK